MSGSCGGVREAQTLKWSREEGGAKTQMLGLFCFFLVSAHVWYQPGVRISAWGLVRRPESHGDYTREMQGLGYVMARKYLIC